MASTEIEIVNLALAAAGASKLLSGDLGTASGAEAAFARTFYPQRRDELLEEPTTRWPWATRRAVLAALAEVVRTDWTYAYALPADCRTVRQVVRPGVRQPLPEDAVPYVLEAGDPPSDPAEDDPLAGEPSSTILLCDLKSAELVYTARVTNPARFSALFAGALAERLAVDFATHLTKKDDLASSAAKRFAVMLTKASVHAAMQRQNEPRQAPDFLAGYDDPVRAARFRFGVE